VTSKKDGSKAAERQIIEQAFSRKPRNYVVCLKINLVLHASTIKQVLAAHDDGRFFSLEENSPVIHLYGQAGKLLDTFGIPKRPFSEQKVFVVQLAYDAASDTLGYLSTDRNIYFCDALRKKSLLHTEDSYTSPCNGIWFLPACSLWVTSTVDHFLTVCQVDRRSKQFLRVVFADQTLITFKAHSDAITCCIELTASKLLCSSSLDGYIRVWSPTSYLLMAELSEIDAKSSAVSTHINAVLGLDYNPDFGGNLISTGYSHHVNVWSPDSSLSKSFVGRLEGHSGVVVCCRMLQRSPNCISADEHSNIKIWDLRSMMAIQTIRNERAASLNVSTIEVLHRLDRFVLGGKSIRVFRNETTRSQIEAAEEEAVPLSVGFNSYFTTMYVVTP